jgi:hypothetical protein
MTRTVFHHRGHRYSTEEGPPAFTVNGLMILADTLMSAFYRLTCNRGYDDLQHEH